MGRRAFVDELPCGRFVWRGSRGTRGVLDQAGDPGDAPGLIEGGNMQTTCFTSDRPMEFAAFGEAHRFVLSIVISS
jgi:hypothetical protein